MMNQKFEEFKLNLSLRQPSDLYLRGCDPVIRLPDPKPAINIVPENLDYDSDEEMASTYEDELIEIDIADSESVALSGVDLMEVELEDIRMKSVQEHYTRPTWSPASLLDRLFCCANVM